MNRKEEVGLLAAISLKKQAWRFAVTSSQNRILKHSNFNWNIDSPAELNQNHYPTNVFDTQTLKDREWESALLDKDK